MTDDDAAKLREPFPASVVGKLPKGGVQLDYVGHAAVTDRLLTVDPEWTWEPMGLDASGLPAYDKSNGLWIKLTVCGVTRLGYGDGPDPKQRISDALRNAAMRFGVALALWGKDGLESEVDAAKEHDEDRQAQRKADYDAQQGGWDDEEHRKAAHQQAAHLARSLPEGQKAVYKAWLEEKGFKQPWTIAEHAAAHTRLCELAGLDEEPF